MFGKPRSLYVLRYAHILIRPPGYFVRMIMVMMCNDILHTFSISNATNVNDLF